MNGKQRLNRLNFDDHALVDKHVESIAHFDDDSLVHNGKDLLGFDLSSHSFELMSKADMVGTFQQSRPQAAVDPIRGTQNAVSCFAVDQALIVSVRVRALRVDAFRQQSAVQR